LIKKKPTPVKKRWEIIRDVSERGREGRRKGGREGGREGGKEGGVGV